MKINGSVKEGVDSFVETHSSSLGRVGETGSLEPDGGTASVVVWKQKRAISMTSFLKAVVVTGLVE